MKTIIVWFRSDLRVHDNPALHAAITSADQVIPVFILNNELLRGKRASSNRNRFLLESLHDLRASLQHMGADLIIREGEPAAALATLAKSHTATAVYFGMDYTPYATKRDYQVYQALTEKNIDCRRFPGRLAIESFDAIHTKLGKPHKVFTPFWKNWQQVPRRNIVPTPTKLTMPAGITLGALPKPEAYTNDTPLANHALSGGETAARKRLKSFLKAPITNYHQMNNDMAADTTSRLSSYLHFGCLSPVEIETMLPSGAGAAAWHRQLAWREFYAYILATYPNNAQQTFQERYRDMKWGHDSKSYAAWQQGQTGYPIVDAAMRQLRDEGWMHNRARLIVGSFLTKDLWIDWRLGEAHFMQLLIDGDEPNNNGNWQWIASVGVDPAPVFRRLYNPTLQQTTYDPSGAYVRRYVHELADVPDKYLAEPWTMPEALQREVGCIIGINYPAPIVDHKSARISALKHFRQATS